MKKQALYALIDSKELFLPKIEVDGNFLNFYYKQEIPIDNFFQDEQMSLFQIHLCDDDYKDSLRKVCLPRILEIFDKWYALWITSKENCLTISKFSNNFKIYWNTFPMGYGNGIDFDFYEELKNVTKRINIQKLYQENKNFKFHFINKD
jgi:hypothetical protein